MNRRTKNRMISTATQAARRRRRRAAAAAALVGAAMAASAFDARVEASTRSWKSTAPAWSSWNIGGNWTPLGQPLDGDSAMIVNTAATERGVYYVNTMFPDATLTTFTLDGIGGATMS